MFANRSRVFCFRRMDLPSEAMRFRPLFLCLLAMLAACVPAMGAPPRTIDFQIVGSSQITGSPSSGYSVPAGVSVTLRVNINDAGYTPGRPGQVQFCDAAYPHCTDIHLLGTSQVNSTGIATYTFRPGPGWHIYKAILLPTTTLGGVTSGRVALAVTGFSTPQASTTTLAATGAAGNYTLTASVPVSSQIVPTGSVSFLDTSNNGYVLGTASFSAGNNSFAFGLASSQKIGNGAFSAVAVDFNGDGIPDLAIPNEFDNNISILLGKGDGTFTTAATVPAGVYPNSIISGDFNDDGIADLVVTNNCQAGCNGVSVTVLLGNGDGTFRSGPTLYTGPEAISVVTADFNGDGEADLAVIDRTANTVTILLGHGDGTFTPTTTPLSLFYPTSIATADLNNDGIADLIVDGGSAGLVSFLGKGDGTFTQLPATIKNVSTYQLSIADYNGDGIPDIAVPTTLGTFLVELGNGDGTFHAVPSNISLPDNTYSTAVADFNADGIADIVVVDFYSDVAQVLLGHGDGTFTAFPQTPSSGFRPNAVVAPDLNSDGFPDLVSVDYRGASLSIALAQLTSTATATVSGVNAVGTGTHFVNAVYAGDPNYTGSTSATVPLTATRVPTTLALTASAATGFPGQIAMFTGTLTPSTAQTHAAGTVVLVTDNGAVIGMASIANGVATYSTSTLAAGAHSIAFAYAGDTNFAASASNVVSYGVVAKASVATTTTLRVTVAGGSLGTGGGPTVTSVGVGTPITLFATVFTGGGAAARPGQVNFCDATAPHCTDIFLIGTAQVTANGTATFQYIPGIGPHTYRAVFVGNNAFVASASATAGLSVTGAYPSITVLTSSGTVGNYSLTATVEGSGHVAPTGMVNFEDTNNNGYVLASAPLSAVTTGFTFYNSSTPANGIGPESSAIGDFNGDGKLDMAVANEGTNNVTILLGNGDGSFTPAASPGAGGSPIDIVSGDFNNDGILDLAVSNDTDNTVTILLGKGDGTFATGQTVPTGGGPFCLTLGDFNGDGNLDMASANIGSSTTNGVSNGNTVTVMLGNGDGTFTVGQTLPTGANPSAVVAADFNSDGKLDLAVANSAGSVLTMYFGNGDGTFTKGADVPTNTTPFWIVVADYNRDGQPDMAVGDLTTGKIAILLGKGDGTFTRATDIPTAGPPNDAMAAGDLNGDGIVDLAITNSTANSLLVVLGNGDGTFTPTTSPATGATPDFVIAGDFDGDGNQDLAVANYGGASTSVLLSKSTATASGAVTGLSPVGTGTHLADAVYSGDSHFGASTSNTVPLTAQQIPTTCMLLGPIPPSALYGTTYDLDADIHYGASGAFTQGHEATGTVSFFSNGTLLGTGTVTPDLRAGGFHDGRAAFSTSSLPPGTDSLTASYPGDTNFTGCQSPPVSVLITQTAPTLTFSVPNHVYLDPPFTVAAQSTSPGAITYSVVSGPATIAGTTVTLTGAGTVTLQASQASSGVYAAATMNATFNVAKAAQTITFPAPATPVVYGTAVTLTATASSGLQVVYTVLSGPATVSGSSLRLTGAGTVVIAADQPGNANFNAAAEVTRTIAVTPVYPAIILTASPNPVFVQNPVTFTATLGSSAGVPTGTVTFVELFPPTALSRVLGTETLSGGVATFVTAGLTVGSHVVGALYNGDASFTPIQSATVTEVVQDFTLTINNPSQVITHGGTAVYSLTLTSVGGAGMAANINFSQAGTPDHSVITYSPAFVATGSGTTNVTLTIATPDYPVGPWGADGPYKGALWLLGSGGLLLPFGRKRRGVRAVMRRLSGAALLLALAVAMTGLSGCGSGWGAQHYPLMVTATSGALSRSAAATLESR